MMWKNYEDEQPLEHDGVKYGSKEMEFARIERLPSHSLAALEVAVNGDAPHERWRALGWSVAEGYDKSETADVYRSYIESSRGEFSVAKNVYVATRSGWFSSRSVNYLASSRPVVVQETGFSDVIPTGHGPFGFSDLDEAARAIANVESDYGHHQGAALELGRHTFRLKGDTV
jgi:hypothetical protein